MISTRNIVSLFLGLMSFSFYVNGQEISESERMKWWEDARLGMFIHWGVYSEYGGEYNGTDHGKEMGGASAEWIYLTADIPEKHYRQTAAKFNPVLYNPTEWVKAAKDAGMKYMVLTSKHHDGFAMFDTRSTKWNIMQSSAYRNDAVKAFVDECHKQGMRVGLYYSHEKDWINHLKVRNNTSAVAESYLKLVETQLTEILTNYGTIDLIWFDMGISQHRELNQMCYNLVRKYQPACIISSRIGNGLGDYLNLGDRELAPPGMRGYTESIMTLRHNWGYDKNDDNWKSSGEVIEMISKCACRNSNFLLNIGPRPDGRFTPEELVRLKNVGEWMHQNGEAIYGTKGSPFKGEYEWGSFSVKGNKIFLHLFRWNGETVKLSGIDSNVEKAYLLSNGQAISFKKNSDSDLIIDVPKETLSQIVPIVVLELKDAIHYTEEKAPVWLPPVEKYLLRFDMTGMVTKVDENGFTIDSEGDEKHFTWNENIRFRKNLKGNIIPCQGFYPEIGEKCRIVYSKEAEPVVHIITLMKNEQGIIR